MAGFTRAQAGVAAGMAAGLAVTVGLFLWPDPPAVPADPGDRLSLWFALAAAAALWLLVAIGRLAGHRFFSPADIDGGGLGEGTARAKLLQSLIQNTLEQLVLALPAWGAWLWLAPPAAGGRVLLCAAAFALGRLLFYAGYARGAPFRALGFTLTFYPTVGLYLLLLPMLAARLFS
jgi:hypothetical protein